MPDNTTTQTDSGANFRQKQIQEILDRIGRWDIVDSAGNVMLSSDDIADKILTVREYFLLHEIFCDESQESSKTSATLRRLIRMLTHTTEALAEMCGHLLAGKIKEKRTWIPDINGVYHCSGCGRQQPDNTDYCPKCGAIMTVLTVNHQSGSEVANVQLDIH